MSIKAGKLELKHFHKVQLTSNYANDETYKQVGKNINIPAK